MSVRPPGVVAWAEIDLDAIAANVRAFIRHVGPAVRVIAVVKANAYGHGAVPVAQTALQAGAQMLAVHRAVEAVALRTAGIDAPVLVLGYTPPDGAELVARYDLTPSLITWEFAQAFSAAAAAQGRQMPAHIKLDSGMSRYGLLPGEAPGFIQAVSRLPGLVIEGLFTHFATADAADPSFTLQQFGVFQDVAAAVRQAGVHIPLLHTANSAATMRLPQTHLQAVRPGVAMYGMNPSDEWEPPFEIQPALAIKSLAVRVRDLPAGATVGYGRTFTARQPLRAALVPVGYGDGYHRALSNRGWVLVRGQRAPLIGRVSMDQVVADVSHIPDVAQDDEVVLLGAQGAERLPAEEVAGLAGTINYEATTSLLPRLVRVYLRAGQVVQVIPAVA